MKLRAVTAGLRITPKLSCPDQLKFLVDQFLRKKPYADRCKLTAHAQVILPDKLNL